MESGLSSSSGPADLRATAKLGPRGRVAFALGVGIVVVATALAVSVFGSNGPKTLSEAETKSLLRQLPYRFEFRPVRVPQGASGAVAGRVIGHRGTVVRFGVSLGSRGKPVSLGPHTDFADATGGATFRVTDDAWIVVNGRPTFGKQIRTATQWHEAATMNVDIEEKLCRATEGKPCAV